MLPPRHGPKAGDEKAEREPVTGAPAQPAGVSLCTLGTTPSSSELMRADVVGTPGLVQDARSLPFQRACYNPNMNPEAQLQAYHQAFTTYLVAERALQIALHLGEEVTPLREKRNELRHIAAGFAQLAANARRAP